MVVCQYFLRGICRFGDRCRNEHQYPTGDTSQSVLRTTTGQVDTETLIRSVSNDMINSERGGQWPLSNYAPFKDKPCYPGFEDRSFEEVRWGMYEAQKNGSLEQFKHQLQQAINDARMKVRYLQNPPPEAVNVIKDLYNSKPGATSAQSVFGNSATIAPNQNSIFGTRPAAVTQTATSSSFSFAVPQNKSIFGGGTTSGPIFAQNTAQPTGSIFGGPNSNQSVFSSVSNASQGQPVYNQQPQQPTNASIFGGNSSMGSIFNQPPTTQNIFGSSNMSVFANQSNTPVAAPVIQQNPFGTPTIPENQSSTLAVPAVRQSPFGLPTIPEDESTFGTSQVQNIPGHQNSIFGQPQQSVQSQGSVFNSSHNQGAVFNNSSTSNSVFTQLQTLHKSPAQADVFAGGQIQGNVFSNNAPNLAVGTVTDDGTVYSKAEELSEDDIKMFNEDSFRSGKIPERPPTIQMCF